LCFLILTDCKKKNNKKKIIKKEGDFVKMINEFDDNELAKIRKIKNAYIKKWRERNPDYNRENLRKAYKKDPERFKKYQNKYWLKKAEEEGY